MSKKTISFIAKPYLQGKYSVVVIIPKPFFDRKMLKPGKKYKFEVCEV